MLPLTANATRLGHSPFFDLVLATGVCVALVAATDGTWFLCVVDTCAPDGRVRAGAEVWFAHSVHDSPLTPGTLVIVRDIEGLQLIVECTVERAAQ